MLKCDTKRTEPLDSPEGSPTKSGGKSSDRKKSLKLHEKSPTKKSMDHSKINQGPGLKNFAREIAELASSKLPHISEDEIQQFQIPEDLTEIERCKILIKKKNLDQQSYFFNNIENIFEIKKQEYSTIYGQNYDDQNQSKFNYDTQPQFTTKTITKPQKKSNSIIILEDDSSSESDDMKPYDRELHSRRKEVQDEIFPIILGKWLDDQSELMKIIVGEAFLTLLKCDQITIELQYLIKLDTIAKEMLNNWNTDMLEIWIEVYAIVISKIINKKSVNQFSVLDACKQKVSTMSDRNQTIKVRIKVAQFVGLLAKYKSFGSSSKFEQMILKSAKKIFNILCQDIHWEVRKEMCCQLIHIAKYIGSQKTIEYIIPELQELLDDEEGEVVTESIIQFYKITNKVLDEDFIKQNESLELFNKICDMTAEKESETIDLALVIKKFGKLMLTHKQHVDKHFVGKLLKIIENAKSSAFDEEIRSMLPCLFQSLALMYHEKDMSTLIEIYQSKISEFISHQIKIGIPTKEKTKALPTSLYFEIEKKDKYKQDREMFEDQNILVNIKICQNMHFFFGAFISHFQKDENQLIEITYDETKLENCILNILQNYLKLLKTKDRELMHYVLFSFVCYHSKMTSIDIWVKLNDEIRQLYMDILIQIKKCNEVVQYSYRYQLTFIKSIETLIDSQCDHNENHQIYLKNNDIHLTLKQIAVSKQFQIMIVQERKEALKILKGIIMSKTIYAPVRNQVNRILIKIIQNNRSSKIRALAQEIIQSLSKSKFLSHRHSFINYIEIISKESLCSSRTFTKNYLDSLLSLYDDQNIISLQIKMLTDVFPHVCKFVSGQASSQERFFYIIRYAKQKVDCKSSKTSLEKELIEETKNFIFISKQQEFITKCQDFINILDEVLIEKEDLLSGNVVIHSKGNTSNRNGKRPSHLSILQSNDRINIPLMKQKKPTSTRSVSKQGSRHSIQIPAKDQKVDTVIQNSDIHKTNESTKNGIFSRPTSHAFVKRGGSNMMGNNIIKNRASPDISKGIHRINKSNYNSQQTHKNEIIEKPPIEANANENPIKKPRELSQVIKITQQIRGTPTIEMVNKKSKLVEIQNEDQSRHSAKIKNSKHQMVLREQEGNSSKMLPPIVLGKIDNKNVFLSKYKNEIKQNITGQCNTVGKMPALSHNSSISNQLDNFYGSNQVQSQPQVSIAAVKRSSYRLDKILKVNRGHTTEGNRLQPKRVIESQNSNPIITDTQTSSIDVMEQKIIELKRKQIKRPGSVSCGINSTRTNGNFYNQQSTKMSYNLQSNSNNGPVLLAPHAPKPSKINKMRYITGVMK